MALDLELYRRNIRLPYQAPINISVIDINPDYPSHTIVFLHGYGGQAMQWEYQLDEFSTSNRLIAPDLRGHGKSDKPNDNYSMANLVKDLSLGLEELGVEEKFLLVGHSFGGAIATEYAIAHPEMIGHLILIATAGEFRLVPVYRFLLNLPEAILRKAERLVRSWLSAPPHVMRAMYHQNVANWNGWSLFRSLNVPTTVIRGQYDRVFSKPLFDEVTRAIPNAEEIDVGASGHLVMLERRQAVNRAINRSLEFQKRSWRSEETEIEVSSREILIQQRPWLSHYDEGIPYTIAVPKTPLNQFLRSARSRFSRHTALIFEGKQISYQALQHDVFRFSNALLSLGIEPGDRVMLLLPNLPQTVIAFFGILEAGAVAVFTNPITDTEELYRQLKVTQAKVLITLDQFDELITKLKSDLPNTNLSHVIITNISYYLPLTKKLLLRLRRTGPTQMDADKIYGVFMQSFRSLLSSQSTEPTEITVPPENLATILFTGGTTAVPKGVMLSHKNLVANALQTRHWMPTAEEGKERFLCVLPFSHSYGLTTALNTPIILGATLIIKAKFDTIDTLKTIQRYRPTLFPGVPNMYMALKDHPEVRKYGISSIKACISGAAPLPIEVQEAFEKLTRGRLVEGYGLTEASPATHANPLFGKRKIGTIGLPFPSTEARVVDLRRGKQEVKVGQIGELAVRGPQVMMGYWEDPKSTRKAINPEGFLLTGDIAQMDVEGYFRIIARKADMWYPEKPGEPAFPRDVEEVLFEIPQIKDAAVVAIANQPIAFVVVKGERPGADEIIAYCKRRLPPKQVPRLVIFVEEFPRTFIGKILRRELAARFEQSQSEQQDHSNDQQQVS